MTGELLRVVSVLSPQGVRRDLLDTLDVPDMKDSDGGAVDAALQRCVRRSLLSWSVSADSVIMHRLVGRVLRERDRASRGWSSTLATVLGLLEPHLFDESRAWGQRDLGSELVSQIEALWEVTAVEPPDDPDILARELRARSWGVRQLQAAADLTRAIELGLRVAADSERVLGADHPDTLASRNNLAYAYWSVGRLEEAIALLERTLTDSERVLGADHSSTLASRSNLAAAYESAGRLDEAIALYERTLTDSERVLGADHSSTLASRSNLAAAYASARRLDEAIALLERTLTDSERVLGTDHPDTLTVRINLAAAYQSVGRLEEAIALFERTLADCERVLGADHPSTLASRGNLLAAAYQSAGGPRRGDPAIRASPHRLRAGLGRRSPRHPGVPQPPRRRLPVDGAPGGGDRAVGADPHRPRAGLGRRSPRHPGVPQPPRRRLPVRGAPRGGERAVRAGGRLANESGV